MDGLQQMIVVGLAATTFIVFLKMAMVFVPIPGLREVAAFV